MIGTNDLLPKLNQVMPFEKEGKRWVAEGGNALLEESGRALSLMISIPRSDLPQVMRLQALLIVFLRACLPLWDSENAIAASMLRGPGQDDFLIDGQVVIMKKIPGALLLTVYPEVKDGGS